MQLKDKLLIVFCFVLGLTSLHAQLLTEDFETDGGAPDGWQNVEVAGDGTPTSVWLFNDVGPNGPFATAPIASTSSANGWATFDSDSNCNLSEQDAWLISPAIDASAETDVWLVFETYYRSFNDRPQVRVGTDLNDLSSWATFEVFPGITANDFGGVLVGDPAANPQTIQLDLSSVAAGVNGVHFAFQFLSDGSTANGGNLTACGYSWQIDDVVLLNEDPRPENEMRVNSFAAVAPNAITPTNQVEPIGFIADIANAGSLTQDEVILTMSITNQAGEEVYNDQLTYNDIVPDSTAENVFFETEFTPPPVTDIYTATYSLSYAGEDMDFIPGNNQLIFPFEVSDSTFAKEFGATRGVVPAADNSYTYGNAFYINSGTNANGDPIMANSITFGVTNADELAGRDALVLLLEWPEDTQDNFVAEQDEYSIAGLNFYTFTGDEDLGLITVAPDEDGSVPLNEGSFYIAAIQYNTDDNVAMALQASEDFDYAAMNFYTDSLGRERYAGALDVSNTGDISMIGFGLDIVPVVRMGITSDAMVNTVEPQLPTGAVATFPNPADDFVNVDFDLEEPASGELVMFNTKGQQIQLLQLDNVLSDRIQLNTANLPSGTYIIRVRTDQGVSNQMITVQH